MHLRLQDRNCDGCRTVINMIDHDTVSSLFNAVSAIDLTSLDVHTILFDTKS